MAKSATAPGNFITRSIRPAAGALLAALVGAPLALVGCIAEPGGAATSESHAEAIIGGQQAKAGDFPTIVGIYDEGRSTICSGTLIAPNAVLTAAHCVEFAGDADRQRMIAEMVVFVDTLSMYTPVTTISVADIAVHPGYVKLEEDPDNLGRQDVAIIMLKTPVADRRVAHVSRESIAAFAEASYTMVGYGIYDENGNSGKLNSTTDSNIDCALHGVPNGRFFCFDREDGTGSCAGDSGSPLFYTTASGVPAVVGVHSWGSAGGVCTGIGADTKVSGALAFITDQLGDEFTCASDGVCDDTCGDDDVDCSGMPDAACAGDNDCAQGFRCDAGTCQPIDGEPLVTDPAQPDAGGGCSAQGEAGAGSRGLPLVLAGMLLTVARRRRRG
ncbi:MAG: S1 family peptidase [Myxococcales bacterium]|nr:S1 family peptidase [Myxococcales bacterium]